MTTAALYFLDGNRNPTSVQNFKSPQEMPTIPQISPINPRTADQNQLDKDTTPFPDQLIFQSLPNNEKSIVQRNLQVFGPLARIRHQKVQLRLKFSSGQDFEPKTTNLAIRSAQG